MNIIKTISTLIFAALLAACGGGDDDSPISGASYEQTAPAGAITVGAGKTQESATIVSLEHHVGNKISRLTIAANVTGVRSIGATSAGTRWVIRNGNDVIAQGPLSAAVAGGASSGSTSHEVTVSGGSRMTIEITGQVNGAGAALQWDSAQLSLSSKPL